jgi:hypothetical protein
MPFFDELPELPARPGTSGPIYRDDPHSQPEHWSPAPVGIGVLAARTEDTAVRFDVRDAYPRGLAVDIRVLVSPDGPDVEDAHRWRHDDPRLPFIGDLRLGLLWPDGTRAEASGFGPPAHDGWPVLAVRGGGGGGLGWLWHAWLHPLPPAGPVSVHCVWPGRGILETATALDLTPAVEAAALAEELWHLPTFEQAPPEGGWFAYAPLGGSSTVTASAADGSGDAADPGDEDR